MRSLPRSDRARARSSSRPQNRVARRDNPFAIGYQPSFTSVRSNDVSPSSSSSVRSAASASSASVPAKQLSGVINAIKRARRLIEALEGAAPEQAHFARQPAVATDLVIGCDDPLGVAFGAQHPRARVGLVEAQVEDGVVELAARFERFAQRGERPHGDRGDACGSIDVDRHEPMLERAEQHALCVIGAVGRPPPGRARGSRTNSSNVDGGAIASTSPQSTACLPLIPSAFVANTSARSRRTWRLSTHARQPARTGQAPRATGPRAARLPTTDRPRAGSRRTRARARTLRPRRFR